MEVLYMDAAKGTITRRMDAVLDGLQDEFKALCDRADFESKLTALEKAGAKSDRASKLKSLFAMFDMCGIEYERGKDNVYYEELVANADLPDFRKSKTGCSLHFLRFTKNIHCRKII